MSLKQWHTYHRDLQSFKMSAYLQNSWNCFINFISLLDSYRNSCSWSIQCYQLAHIHYNNKFHEIAELGDWKYFVLLQCAMRIFLSVSLVPRQINKSIKQKNLFIIFSIQFRCTSWMLIYVEEYLLYFMS